MRATTHTHTNEGSAVTADSLTIYAVQRTADGQRIDDFDEVIDPDRLGTVDDIRDFQSPENLRPPWSARMYLWQGETRRPSWVEFLEGGFGGDPIEVAGSAQDCAVEGDPIVSPGAMGVVVGVGATPSGQRRRRGSARRGIGGAGSGCTRFASPRGSLWLR